MSARDGEWSAVKVWFHAALEQPATKRAEYLEVGLRAQPALLREVQSLLAAHDQGAERFERS